MSALEGSKPLAVVFGCSGPVLTPRERRLFRQADPLGFILFRRNCRDPVQVARLTADLREAVGREDAPILIDQEGGRVQRLRPPLWPDYPPAQRFGDLAARDGDAAAEAARLNARALAATVRALGIDVNTLPLLDLIVDGASEIIGDRGFSHDPAIVARLGMAVCQGMLAEGVRPVMKHLPGHGRAPVDSHHALPIVDAARDRLEREDFRPFRALAGHDWPVLPWAMTAHVVYTAVDAERPATLSDVVIKQVIRDFIGFRGVLVSDDLCMEALDGPPALRVAAALAAGCDIALHCNGDPAEMEAIAASAPRLRPDSVDRLGLGGRPRRPSEPGDPAVLRAQVRELMATA